MQPLASWCRNMYRKSYILENRFSPEKSISSSENDPKGPIFGLWQDFMHIFHLSVGIFVILIFWPFLGPESLKNG